MVARKKTKSRKSKKSSPMAKYKHQLMDVNECMSKTVKQIRKEGAYRNLVPFGTYKRKSNVYHFGNKSTMKKAQLCEALSNPKAYHARIKKNKGTGKRKGPNAMKNSGKRKRNSRLGNCTPSYRKPTNGSCKNSKVMSKSKKVAAPHKGLTTTAKKCCYKKKQSAATKAKRKRNASKKKSAITKYNSKTSNQKSTKVGRRSRKKKSPSSPVLKRKSKKKAKKSKRKSKRKSKQ